MKYINFTTQDFVSDAYFQKWVLAPDSETDAFWKEWLKTYPFKKEDVKEARQIIELLGFSKDYESNAAFVNIWNNIQENITEEAPAVVEKSYSFWEEIKYYQKVAAVFICFVIIGLAFMLRQPEKPREISYRTTYGQVKNFLLPDSSEVTLNANSVLTYTNDWADENKPRQVYLKGEAFFKVLKKKKIKTDYAKFKVYTDNVTVEVLGTSFNVNDRRSNTQVVLQSGKVKVDLQKPNQQPVIFMKPGEFVNYNATYNHLEKTEVDTRFYTSWTNNELTFDKATLHQIALLLEDNYGYKITFANKDLGNSRFTGTIPSNNISLLFTALTKLFDINIIQNQNEILISTDKAVTL
jgi:transmembrane sensor